MSDTIRFTMDGEEVVAERGMCIWKSQMAADWSFRICATSRLLGIVLTATVGRVWSK